MLSFVVIERCSGRDHKIVNSLDRLGYEAELRAALSTANPLSLKRLKTCAAVGGPEIMLQSHNNR